MSAVTGSALRIRRLEGDLGVVAGLEVIPFGVLTFVVGSLLVVNAWAVVDAKFMVTSAAREAARGYVEAPDLVAARAHARQAVDDVARTHGRAPREVGMTLEDGGWFRCARVTATVHVDVPALRLPWIGGFGRPFAVSAHHSEVVDPFRSGLPGAARC